LSLGDISKDIKEPPPPTIEIPVLDPRTNLKHFSPRNKIYASPISKSPRAQFYFSSLVSPIRTSEAKKRINIFKEAGIKSEETLTKTQNYESIKAVDTLTDWNKRYFKFQPSIADYFVMTEEEKENLAKVSKTYTTKSPKEFLSPRTRPETGLSPLFSVRNRALSPPTETLKLPRKTIKIKKLSKKGSAAELLNLKPEPTLEEREKEPKPTENTHLSDQHQSHIERLEHLSQRLHEIALGISSSLNNFGQRQ